MLSHYCDKGIYNNKDYMVASYSGALKFKSVRVAHGPHVYKLLRPGGSVYATWAPSSLDRPATAFMHAIALLDQSYIAPARPVRGQGHIKATGHFLNCTEVTCAPNPCCCAPELRACLSAACGLVVTPVAPDTTLSSVAPHSSRAAVGSHVAMTFRSWPLLCGKLRLESAQWPRPAWCPKVVGA